MMAGRTVTRLYDSPNEARQVVGDLESAGVPHDDISMVVSNHDRKAGTGAAAGGTAGAVIGGGAGLLAGLGALAIPGVGPVVAAGWLISTVVGAVAGGAAGAATGVSLEL
jgi:hypothetical protein